MTIEAVGENADVSVFAVEEEPVLQEKVRDVLENAEVADTLFQKLIELGLFDYEKKLGNGGFGSVFQLKGGDNFLENVALKVFKYSETNKLSASGSEGEALALQLPDHGSILKTYGMLTYDGKKVYYVEKFDSDVHEGQILLGTVSRVIDGVTLNAKMAQGPMCATEVKGYGKQIAEAIYAIHGMGYAHKDIHVGNIMIHNPAPGQPLYKVTIIDFNLAREVTQDCVDRDWRWFGFLLSEMGDDDLIFDPNYYDLVYSEKHGLLCGHQPYTEAQVVNHPFFR